MGVDVDVDELMKRAKPHTLKDRVNFKATAQTRKRIERLSEAKVDLAEGFNLTYHAILKAHNIKSLVIRSTDSRYITLREVAQQAKEFCDLFDLDFTEGSKTYLRMGIKILGRKFSLYRLKGSADRIVETYQNMQTLLTNRKAADKMYKAWQGSVQKYFNQSMEISDVNQYVNFHHAAKEADEAGADYDDWCDAQFERLSFMNVMPELSQLHGDKATYNYNKFNLTTEKQDGHERQYFKQISKKAIVLKKNKDKAGQQEAAEGTD